MRPSERCGGRGQAPGTAGQTRESTASLAEHAEVGKQAALTRLGEILAAMPKNAGIAAGGRRSAAGSTVELADATPTLADLGIDKKVSK